MANKLLEFDIDRAFLSKLKIMKQMEKNRKDSSNAPTREDFFADNVSREDLNKMIELSIEALEKRLSA